MDDRQKELLGVIYSVLLGPSRVFVGMLVELKNGTIVNHNSLPSVYKGRVKIEGNASLVIKNVTPQDNTIFKCALIPDAGTDQESEVQLIVTGKFLRFNNCSQ